MKKLPLLIGATFSLALLSFAPLSAKGNPRNKPQPQTSWFPTAVTVRNPGTTVVENSDGSFYFSLPLCAKGAGPLALVTTYDQVPLGNLANHTISASFSVQATGSPQFTYWGMGTTANPGNTPASVRLVFMTRTGFSTAWADEVWYSNPTAFALSLTGGIVLSETLSDPSKWSNGQGQWGNSRVAEFTAATANVHEIGFAFGGGSFFDVGVGVVQGTGTATFNVGSFLTQ